jgi:hypothetical protein
MLIIFSPGHIEGLFREITTRKSGDDIAALSDKFGCLIVGPPLHEGTYNDRFTLVLRERTDDVGR